MSATGGGGFSGLSSFDIIIIIVSQSVEGDDGSQTQACIHVPIPEQASSITEDNHEQTRIFNNVWQAGRQHGESGTRRSSAAAQQRSSAVTNGLRRRLPPHQRCYVQGTYLGTYMSFALPRTLINSVVSAARVCVEIRSGSILTGLMRHEWITRDG
ncbi:hypothetical protein BKA81DRAFT_196376 [Phyllosticta paracitricarpa]